MVAMSNSTPSLAWTGERMIPFVSDYATQATHFQRYLFFRPWYEDAKVIDAACGEGYGTDYASLFATSAQGVDLSDEATAYASSVYSGANFVTGDVCTHDYSGADMVVSFETIEHLPEPEKFLEAVSACKGRIVISTPNRRLYDPNAKLGDKPSNPYHTIEWTSEEFAELIQKHFPDRQVRFLSQKAELPGRLYEGLDPMAWFVIAVIGDGELPKWPKVGLSMPTVDNFGMGKECISAFTTYYPGEIDFAVVLNGTSEEQKSMWRGFAAEMGGTVQLIELGRNLGYGQGANLGLDHLYQRGGYDAYGVTNDDVYPALGCMPELMHAFNQLQELDKNPGLVAVVSNRVHGSQQVTLPAFTNIVDMMREASKYLGENASSVTEAFQIRGLFFVMPPACLESIGGFDPIFGLGNLEDDDYSLRAKLAGFSNWIVDGAWLYHEGSQTFGSLGIDYERSIEENVSKFMQKWKLSDHSDFIHMTSAPQDTELFVPLKAEIPASNYAVVNGHEVDLLNSASDMDFAFWVFGQISRGGLETRKVILDALRAGELKLAA